MWNLDQIDVLIKLMCVLSRYDRAPLLQITNNCAAWHSRVFKAASVQFRLFRKHTREKQSQCVAKNRSSRRAPSFTPSRPLSHLLQSRLIASVLRLWLMKNNCLHYFFFCLHCYPSPPAFLRQPSWLRSRLLGDVNGRK